jgi:hypothetical protein
MPLFGNNIYNYRDNYILNEAYIGKTKTLLEIEDQIGLVREKISFYKNINQSEEMLKLNRLIEKQFNPKLSAIQVIKSNLFNVSTNIIGWKFDIVDNIKMSEMVIGDRKNGYRFKNGNNFCLLIDISYGILASKELSNGEILAFILHEIGHNFADCIYDKIEINDRTISNNLKKIIIKNKIALIFAAFSSASTTSEFINILDSKNRLNNQKQLQKQIKLQSKKPNFIKEIINGMIGRCNDLESFSQEICSRLFGRNEMRRSLDFLNNVNGADSAKKSISRQNEVLADKFAAIYGYGVELSSGLSKLYGEVTPAKKFINRFGNFGEKINQSYDQLLRELYNFDSHGQPIQRIYSTIKTLKNELGKKDLDPKLKKSLQSQLDDIFKILVQNTTSSDKLTKDQNLQNSYYNFINMRYPDAIQEDLESAIEKALDDVLNGKYRGE